KRYALLVGVKEYEHARLPTLKYSENDVTELAKLLRKSAYQVSLLCDSEGKKNEKNAPTKANIERQLKAVLEKVKPKDSVLVAFAGHGLQFENLNMRDAFFCPSDARPFETEVDSLVSLGKVYEQMDRSFARVKVLFVDACRDDPKAGRGSRGIDADSAPSPPRGVAALFSCSAG